MHLTPKQLFCRVIWCKNFFFFFNPRIFMRCQNRVSNHGSWHKVRRAKRRWLSKSGLPFSTSAVAISPHKFFAGTPVPSQHISVFSNNVFYFVGFRNECWLRRLWNLLYRWRHEVGLHLDCKTVVFGRFRKAGSAISVILECEAREPSLAFAKNTAVLQSRFHSTTTKLIYLLVFCWAPSRPVSGQLRKDNQIPGCGC